MSTSPRFVIVICFEDATRRRFLMVRNRRRGWELPGGGIEAAEDPLDAARREFTEETGQMLADARVVLEQERASGRCWIVSGFLSSDSRPQPRKHGEAVVGHAFVDRLGERMPLAFPDDPYAEIGAALGRDLLRGVS